MGAYIKIALKRFFQSERAGTMTMTAIIIPVLLGFSGVGLDLTHWYMQKRTVQSLADMSAIEGVHTGTYYNGDDLKALITSFAEGEGYDTAHDQMTVNTPPSLGGYMGRNGFVEVNLSRSVQLYFLSIFSNFFGGAYSVDISARAVAGAVTVGEQCIVSLDPTMDRALEFAGSSIVTTGCGVAANSSSSEAIYIGGSASLAADPAQAVGDIFVSGSGTLITNSPLQSYAESVDDPFETIPMPPDTPCDYTDMVVKTDGQILTEGKYCGGLKIQADNVQFESGVYVLYDGDFVTNANTSMNGDELTFLLTGSTPSNIGTVTMNGGTEAAFTAPTSGIYKGILFYQDRNAPYMLTSSMINGGTTGSINGVFYFPSSEIDFLGGSSVGSSCMLIFGAKVTFSGNSDIGIDTEVCEDYGLEDVALQKRVQLVE